MRGSKVSSSLDSLVSTWKQIVKDQPDTGLPKKDETTEMTVRNLFCHFSLIQGYLKTQIGLFLCLNLIVNHPNTILKAEIKNQTLNRHNLSVLGRLYSLILSGYPFKCTSDGFILFVSV